MTGKIDLVKVTQPMLILRTLLASNCSPMISSVLPPPISITNFLPLSRLCVTRLQRSDVLLLHQKQPLWGNQERLLPLLELLRVGGFSQGVGGNNTNTFGGKAT